MNLHLYGSSRAKTWFYLSSFPHNKSLVPRILNYFVFNASIGKIVVNESNLNQEVWIWTSWGNGFVFFSWLFVAPTNKFLGSMFIRCDFKLHSQFIFEVSNSKPIGNKWRGPQSSYSNLGGTIIPMSDKL